jgi:general stress protein 26
VFWRSRFGVALVTQAIFIATGVHARGPLAAVPVTDCQSAQKPAAGAPPREAILSAARTIIGKARYASLITLDDKGQPQARLVDPFEPDATFVVWIGTNPLTRKVGQIQADPRVTMLYFDPASSGYVTLIGRARVVRDPTEKANHWKDAWTPLYKDKNRGDDYVLIRVEPSRLEVVSVALGMINDPKTWRPVGVDLR